MKKMRKHSFEKKYKYQKIAEDIKRNIFNNHYSHEGNTLPSIRQFSSIYNVATNTVVEALHLLKKDGIIYNYRTANYRIVENIEEIRLTLAKELIEKLIKKMGDIGFTQCELMVLINEYLNTQINSQ